jgi:hypothetical protein
MGVSKPSSGLHPHLTQDSTIQELHPTIQGTRLCVQVPLFPIAPASGQPLATLPEERDSDDDDVAGGASLNSTFPTGTRRTHFKDRDAWRAHYLQKGCKFLDFTKIIQTDMKRFGVKIEASTDTGKPMPEVAISQRDSEMKYNWRWNRQDGWLSVPRHEFGDLDWAWYMSRPGLIFTHLTGQGTGASHSQGKRQKRR